jgi:hypothetical protein
MVKGSEAKAEVISKILEYFSDNAFAYNGGKEIRINMTENGEPVQIKLAVTCAKAAVEPGDEDAVPGTKPKVANAFDIPVGSAPSFGADKEPIEATEEERAAIADLMASLNL